MAEFAPQRPAAAQPQGMLRILIELECGSERYCEVVEVDRARWEAMTDDQREQFCLDERVRVTEEQVQTFGRVLKDHEQAPE